MTFPIGGAKLKVAATAACDIMQRVVTNTAVDQPSSLPVE